MDAIEHMFATMEAMMEANEHKFSTLKVALMDSQIKNVENLDTLFVMTCLMQAENCWITFACL